MENKKFINDLCSFKSISDLPKNYVQALSAYSKHVSTNEHSLNRTLLPALDQIRLLLACKDKQSRDTLKLYLVQYFYPVMILFGIVGNSLCLLLLVRNYRSKAKKHSNNNFSFCLAILCCADLAVIIFGCLREYVDEMFAISIRATSIHMCKFFYFVCYLFSSYSSYLYSFIAWERWRAISNPIQYNQSKRNKKTLLLIFVYSLLTSLPFLFNPTLKEYVKMGENDPLKLTVTVKCLITDDSDVILFFLDSILFCFVPFLINFLFSILTLNQLIRVNRLRNLSKHMISNNSSSAPSRSPMSNNIEMYKFKKVSLLPPSSMLLDDNNFNKMYGTPSKTGKQTKLTSNIKLTLMLLTFPLSYLFANIPIFMIISLKFIDYYFGVKTLHNYQSWLSVARILMFLNNSMNILLIILFGKGLRRDFFRIILFRKNKM